ncbi:MAG: DUF3247 family protein [Lysobacter sp.]|nr:MAG: DUF3247 family protein [Lysobacter sp.]
MRIADTVYTDQADIDRLQAMIAELWNDRHVALRLDDGREFAGLVAARPILQQFFNRDGGEGSNAIVRIVQPAPDAPATAGWVDLFLDRIIDIRPVGHCEPAAGSLDLN